MTSEGLMIKEKGKEEGRKEEEVVGEEGGPARKAHFYFLGNSLFISKTLTEVLLERKKVLGSYQCVCMILT